MIQIPLSQIDSHASFEAEVLKHRAALDRHNRGGTGVAVPTSTPWVESVIKRVPQTGPVADRGPDDFVIEPYEIVDDRPVSPEVQILRESILK
jgi:hypothetical protein